MGHRDYAAHVHDAYLWFTTIPNGIHAVLTSFDSVWSIGDLDRWSKFESDWVYRALPEPCFESTHVAWKSVVQKIRDASVAGVLGGPQIFDPNPRFEPLWNAALKAKNDVRVDAGVDACEQTQMAEYVAHVHDAVARFGPIASGIDIFRRSLDSSGSVADLDRWSDYEWSWTLGAKPAPCMVSTNDAWKEVVNKVRKANDTPIFIGTLQSNPAFDLPWAEAVRAVRTFDLAAAAAACSSPQPTQGSPQPG